MNSFIGLGNAGKIRARVAHLRTSKPRSFLASNYLNSLTRCILRKSIMFARSQTLLISLPLLLSVWCTQAWGQVADTVYTGGKVYTVN